VREPSCFVNFFSYTTTPPPGKKGTQEMMRRI
jgi:hypothetical protein